MHSCPQGSSNFQKRNSPSEGRRMAQHICFPTESHNASVDAVCSSLSKIVPEIFARHMMATGATCLHCSTDDSEALATHTKVQDQHGFMSSPLCKLGTLTSEAICLHCSADGSHSEGAWARAAQQCNRTVHMLALHVADSLQIVAGPGEPHAPRLCIESISE